MNFAAALTPLLIGFLGSAQVSHADLVFTSIGLSGSPFGINNANQIVGTSVQGEQIVAFLFSNGLTQLVTAPGSSDTFAYGINNAGQIVGTMTGTTGTSGFLQSDGIFLPINIPGSSGTTARGINDVGQIVGYFSDGTGHQIGFLDPGDSFTEISVPGAFSTFPYSINNAGEVVGYFTDSSGNETGFIYMGGIYTTVAVPGSSNTFVYGVNNAGQIVGSFIDSFGTHGFLQSNGLFTVFDAPDTPPTSGTFARDINDAGQILVFGSGSGTFLATLPSPAKPRAVSIQFVGSGTAMAATESAGVVAKTNWNNASGNASSSALALVDETGVASGATVTWISDNVWNLSITDSPGNYRMMRGYLDNGNPDPTIVNVSGLPTSSTGYDIYVYTSGDYQTATKTATFQLSGPGITTTSITAIESVNTMFSGTFTEAINSAGNYVKFTAIQATSFTLTATGTAASDGYLRAPVNAIQIVPSPVATARAVSIKFVGTGTAMGAPGSAGLAAETNWNNATNNVSTTALSLADETGAANGASVTWTADKERSLPMPQLKVEQGIRTARTIFDKCFFDGQKCAHAAPPGNTEDSAAAIE